MLRAFACSAAIAVVAAAVFSAGIQPSHAQTSAQQKCIVDINKSGRKLSKATGKSAGRCLRDASKGSLATTIDACVDATDAKESKAGGKTLSAELKRCGSPPPYGYSSGATVNTAVADELDGLLRDAMGANLDAALAGTSDGQRCQQRVQRAYAKVVDTKLKTFEKCKKTGLKIGGITTSAGLQSCSDVIAYPCGGGSLTMLPPWASCKEPAKVLKAISKLNTTVLKECTGLDTDVIFPGVCVGEPDFRICLEARVECRVCRLLNTMDDLSIDCDSFDDGDGTNNSCPAPGSSTSTTNTTNTTVTTQTTTTTTGTPVCGNGSVEAGEQCDDGNTAAGDCCSPTCQFDAAGTSCMTDLNSCTDDECDGTGTCDHNNNADPCDDLLFCNGADNCAGGTCSVHGGDPCAGPDADGNCEESCDEGADDCGAIDPPGFGCDSGGCLPCADGDRCVSQVGCISGVCSGGSLTMPPPWATCQTPSCSDTLQNGGESDVDCGGVTSCPRCPAGSDCTQPGDCTSGVCSIGECQAPTCLDGILNGDETDVDCGGSCPGCAGGGDCTINGDCESLICSSGTCTTASCSDGVKNQSEGDIDCGGPCADCVLNQSCNTGTDCETGSCNAGFCKCPGTLFTFNVSSNSGGVFDSAEWPGGTQNDSVPGGCTVDVKIPGDNIDLVCALGGGGFAVNSFSGFSSCAGSGGDGGCFADNCPPAGIPSCCQARPSCSAALNGSGNAHYDVQCNP